MGLTRQGIMDALRAGSLKADQAAAVAAGPLKGGLSWDDLRALRAAILSPTDRQGIEAHVRERAPVWAPMDSVDAEVSRAISDAEGSVLEFISSGEDVQWLTDVLAHCAEIEIPVEEFVGESNPKSTWGSRRRRLTRADFATKVALHLREQAGHLEERCKEEPDAEINWAGGARQRHHTTRHALWRAQHAETVAMATRVLAEWTPWRLWRLERDIEDAARDDLHDHLMAFTRGTGRAAELAGNDIARRCRGLFEQAMDEWMKAEER